MEKRNSNLRAQVLAPLLTLICGSMAGWLPGPFSNSVMAASTASIRGIVKDDGGKPLRGARITATAGYRSISRFADSTGQYKITGLKPDTYEVAATAWGFEQKQNRQPLAGDVEMSFTLAPKWDIRQLTTAEWLSALPRDEDMLKLEASCVRCHTLSWIIKDKGLTAAQWVPRIMAMGDAFVTPHLTKEDAIVLAAILEKYFGPNSPLPTREQVHHEEISDAALRATIKEYKPPTKSMIHSIMPDSKGFVWFAEFDKRSGKLGRLHIASEEIQEIPMPSSWRRPNIPWESRDGTIWISEISSKGDVNKSGDDKRLATVDPRTGKITEYTTPEGISCGHTIRDDPEGNIWCTYDPKAQLVKFDPRTKKFQFFDVPKPPSIPEFYYRTVYFRAPDLTKPKWSLEESRGSSPPIYDLSPDAEGNVWYTLYEFGYIGRLDPKTGKSKLYQIPGAGRIKGVDVGKDGNIWFGNALGHTLGKLDPKTGQVEQYRPPTPYAAFYTPVYGAADKSKKAEVWLSDWAGSQMTKFDPATKEFTEYPLPRPDQIVRFFGVDPQGRVWYGDTEGVVGMLDPGDTPTPVRPTRKISAVTSK
jgi:streptogramin lyase